MYLPSTRRTRPVAGTLPSMTSEDVRIVVAASPEDLDAVRALFAEYASSLGWEATGHMADELAGLPGSYAPPRGALLLAICDGEPAGALGLQPVPDNVRIPGTGAETAGELKRLYVRPTCRTRGVGRALMRRAEMEASTRGYDALVLTTSTEMMPLAQHLYESLGYVETAPYRDDMPWPDIRWMRKPLPGGAPDRLLSRLDAPAPTERMLYEHASAHHQIHVTELGFIRILRFMHNRQSSMYLDAPFDTDFEYPGYFHIALALKPDAVRTLVIGLGGATVVKRMWRDYPTMRIDAVELDPEVVDVARRFFALPDDDRIRVFVGDGRAFVETSVETYDIVLIDAFDEDVVPRALTTEEFMRAIRDHLTSDGVAAYNFIGAVRGDRSKPFRSLYRTLRNVWRHVWVFAVSDGIEAEGANLILFATDADVTCEELRARIVSRVDGRVTVPAFDRFGEDLYTGEIRRGDVPLIVDPQRAHGADRRHPPRRA